MSKKDRQKQETPVEEIPLEELEQMESNEEVIPENPQKEDIPDEEYEQLPLTMEQLLSDLEKATAIQEEYLTMAQRVQADFDNFRRRNSAVRAEAYDEGARDLAKALLPVVDNLERAIAAAADSADKGMAEGVQLVYKQLIEVFEKRSITIICRLGEKFDPNLENAVLQGAAEDGEPGTVCEVFQKGYQMGNHVVRHAMVKVVPE